MNTKEFKELISAAMIFFILITAACNDNEAAKQLITEATQQDKENEEEKAKIEQYIQKYTKQYKADKTFDTPYKKPTDEHYYKPIAAENSELIDNGWNTYGAPLTTAIETFVEPKQGKLSYNPGEKRCTVGHGDTFNFAGPDKDGIYYIYKCNEESPMNKEIMFHYIWGSRLWFLNQLKLHLKINTLPRLRAAFEGYKKKCEDAGKEFNMTLEELPPNQLWALLFVGVQTEEDYPEILERLYTKGITEDDEVNAFLFFSDKSKMGTLDRRYWLGLLYAGKIAIDDFLTFKLDKFSVLETDDFLEPVGTKKPSNNKILFVFYDEKDKTYKKFKTGEKSINANKNKVTNEKGQTAEDYLQKVNNDKNDDDTKIKIFAYMDIATEYLNAGKYNKAIQMYEEIIKIDTNEGKTVYQDLKKATEYMQAKRPDKAIEAIEIYALNPTHVDLYTEAHCCYLAGIIRDAQAQHGDENKIIEAYTKANANFGAAYDKKQNTIYKEAKDKYETIQKTIEKYMGEIKEKKDKLDKTSDDAKLDKAKLYYGIGQIRENFAQFLQTQNNFVGAKKQFIRAIKNYDEAVNLNNNDQQYKKAKSDAENKLKNLKDKTANKEPKQTSFINAKRSINGMLASKQQHNKQATQALRRYKQRTW